MKKQRKYQNLSGRKFGKLTIITLSKNRNKFKQLLWICECDCGNKIELPVGNIKKQVVSCGCFKRTPKSDKGVPGLKRLYKSYRNGAKARKLIIDISLEEF